MSTWGVLFMALSWGLILFLLVFCYHRILKKDRSL